MKKINSQYWKSNLFLSREDFNVDDWSFLGRLYRADADRRSKLYVRLYKIKLTWTFKLKAEREGDGERHPTKTVKKGNWHNVQPTSETSGKTETVKHDKGSIYQEHASTLNISNQHQSTWICKTSTMVTVLRGHTKREAGSLYTSLCKGNGQMAQAEKRGGVWTIKHCRGKGIDANRAAEHGFFLGMDYMTII